MHNKYVLLYYGTMLMVQSRKETEHGTTGNLNKNYPVYMHMKVDAGSKT